MALLCFCRFIIISSSSSVCPFSRKSLHTELLFTTAKDYNLSFPQCPPKFCQVTAALSLSLPLPLPLPLPHHHHQRFKPSYFSTQSSSTMENPPQDYRRNVGICLMNPSSKKIFAASRLDIPEAWQMPQGGIDESEDPRIAAMRELREETGVITADIVAEVPYWLTYDFPPAVREKLKRQWGSDWKGQAQKWFLFNFTGKGDDINLLGDGTEKAEFGEWAWMSPEQIIDHAVEFKKPVYEEVLSVFSPYLQ